MTSDEGLPTDDPSARALDAALARALAPPALPAHFNARLQAALVRERTGTGARAASRAQAQREQRERLAELDADYLRLRRRTLGTLIGGAFAAGAAVTVALPWLQANYGSAAIYLLASAGALIGIGIGTASWIGRLRIPNPLERL
ncbi:MAG TPA: hypothetical protein VII41_04285 [Steroidobacteraceae bacterium]